MVAVVSCAIQYIIPDAESVIGTVRLTERLVPVVITCFVKSRTAETVLIEVDKVVATAAVAV